jgi:hypothetical protein
LSIEQAFDTVDRVEATMASLQIAAAKGRPVTTAEARLIEVPGALGGLFPDGGIRRGSTVVIGASSGGSSVALALAAAVTSGGSWLAAVGLPSLGLVAASELGVGLERLALVPRPGDQWTVVAAALLDGVDLLLLRPPVSVRRADARRLMARVRERGVVMVVLEGGNSGRSGWPESPDFKLTVTRSAWDGLGAGYGHLMARQVDISLTGRRAAARERRRTLWLPGREGEIATPAELPADGTSALVS